MLYSIQIVRWMYKDCFLMILRYLAPFQWDYLFHSHVDLVMIDKSCRAPISKLEIPIERGPTSLIRVFAEVLRGCSWCEGLTIVEFAPIPLIRLNCKPELVTSEGAVSPLEEVVIDITIEGSIDQSNKKVMASGMNGLRLENTLIVM